MPKTIFSGFPARAPVTEGIPARDAAGQSIWLNDRVRVMASGSEGVVVAIETADDLRRSRVSVQLPGIRKPLTIAAVNLRSCER